MKKKRIWLGVIGAGVMMVGFVALAKIPLFYMHSNRQGKHLIQTFSQEKKQSAPKKVNLSTFDVKNPTVNALVGEIQIPKISLQAPILEGTSDKQINVAVGHLHTSVFPGDKGTSVLAGHNATWFRNIGQLSNGDSIVVTTKYGQFNYVVTKSQIVHTGASITNTSDASIALEACYPFNALYLTPYRYFVYAKLVSAQTPNGSQRVTSNQSVGYTVVIPSEIEKEGVTLATNSLPMGTLSYTGKPSKAFIQSNSPLNASHALVELYLAWVHASSDKNSKAIHSLFEKSVQSPLFGYPLKDYHYISSFNIQMNVNENDLVSVRGTVTIQTNRRYTIEITALPNGKTLSISSIKIQ